jgi:hypothetical protein
VARKKRQLQRNNRAVDVPKSIGAVSVEDPNAEFEDDADEAKDIAVKSPVGSAVEHSPRVKGPSKRTEVRESRRVRSQARRTRRRLLIGLGGGAIAAALIAGLVLPSVGALGGGGRDAAASQTGTSAEGQLPTVGSKFPAQDAGVIELGEPHGGYSSSPPTSGPRYAVSTAWGTFDEKIADEVVVRNLEQGGVVFNHNITNDAALDDLKAYVEIQPGFPGCFLLQPNEAVPEGTVTLTAWEWLANYAPSDVAGMQEFVKDHRNSAPLFLSNTCGADAPAPAG